MGTSAEPPGIYSRGESSVAIERSGIAAGRLSRDIICVEMISYVVCCCIWTVTVAKCKTRCDADARGVFALRV